MGDLNLVAMLKNKSTKYVVLSLLWCVFYDVDVVNVYDRSDVNNYEPLAVQLKL